MTLCWQRSRGLMLVAVVAGTLVAGCGGSSDQGSSSSGAAGGGNGSSSAAGDSSSGGGGGKDPSTHPCDFVTKAEAEGIIKQPIDPPHVGVAGGCNYTGSGSSNLKETILAFTTSRDRSDYDNGKKALKDPQDIGGLGDAATCETHVGTAGTTAQLLVYSKKGKQTITVTGDSCDENKQFAEKAVGRL